MLSTLISSYFPQLSSHQIDKLEAYRRLLLEWNSKVNLISRKDEANVAAHHILHSLGILKATDIPAGAHIVDVGTGGGLPGVPLAICNPGANFHLVDSRNKKMMALADIVENLELTNVRTFNQRAETLPFKYDMIVGRAVTNLPDLVPIAFPLLKHKKQSTIRKLVYLKGGDFEPELQQLPNKHEIVALAEHFTEPFFESKKVVVIYPS